MSESMKKWLLLKEIASYSAQPEKQHVYKSGLNKGKVKIIKETLKRFLITVSIVLLFMLRNFLHVLITMKTCFNGRKVQAYLILQENLLMI